MVIQMTLQNKFQKITQKLVNNSLWCSTITYIPRISVKNGLENTFEEQESITLKVVVTSVDKNLVDNTNILPTDLQFLVDNLSLPEPKITDLVKFNDKLYKIVQIIPIGVLNNISIAYKLIIRLA